MTKALVLLSGGLDSILAVKVLQEQGVDVAGISFVTPFFGAANARQGARDLNIELIVEDITKDHLDIVKSPQHGYGKQMNPCIDCHTLMIAAAGRVMEREGFDFIATGEVLGERPMSQNYDALMGVARRSGYGEYVLRPLSAQLLPPTKPERDGLVDRDRLLSIEGRSRKPQMALVEKYGITRFVQPAGGCRLTDPAFSSRLRDLLDHTPDAGRWDCELLARGRHFRFPDGAKVVVGRDQRDNESLAAMARPQDVVLFARSVPGPTTLVAGGGSEYVQRSAAELTASYADAAAGSAVKIERRQGDTIAMIEARAEDRTRWDDYRI